MNRQDSNQAGSALMMSLVVTIVLTALASAYLASSHTNFMRARTKIAAEKAFQAAEAGLDLAVVEARTGQDLGKDGIGNGRGAINGGNYEVTMNPPYSGAAKIYLIRSIGAYGDSQRGLEALMEERAAIEYGLFADAGIEVIGGFSIDSFDSNAGTYGSQVVDHGGELYANAEGSLGSNADIDLSMSSSSGLAVYGDANPGPAGTVIAPENVQGSTAPSAEPSTLEPYAYEPPATYTGTGHFSSSGVTTLTAGTFHWETFSLKGGAELTLDGDMTIYVDKSFASGGMSLINITPGSTVKIHHGGIGGGVFSVSGKGFVNTSMVPLNLQIFSASTGDMYLEGAANFYGTIYAPQAMMQIKGDAEYFGAFAVGEARLFGSGMFHYDTALRGSGVRRLKLVTIREFKP